MKTVADIPLPRIVIVGASGHGKVVADLVEKAGVYEITYIIDDNMRGQFVGFSVEAGTDSIPSLVERGFKIALVAIGDAATRKAVGSRLLSMGMQLGIAIHPSAVVARGVKIGNGTVVMAGAVIGPDCCIGAGCIINTNSNLDHDCILGDYVQLAPGAHVAGKVKIGEGTFVGVGANIRDGISIGAWSLIGVGAAVIKNIPDKVVAYGVPARVIRPA